MNYRAICSVLRAEEMIVVEEVESLSRVVRGAQSLLQHLHNTVIEDSVINECLVLTWASLVRS